MSITRGQRYFPQLEGLKRGLDAVIAAAPRSTPDGNKLNRSDADIQQRLDKQAAKLARRAARHASGGR